VYKPQFFYIYDLPDWVRSSIKMFADDTKLGATISDMNGNHMLQDDLRKLRDWSDKIMATKIQSR